MNRRSALFLSLAAGTFAIANFGTSTPAAAACAYAASNGTDWQTTGYSSARRERTACRRAKRRCERNLRKARRRNQISRGTETPKCRRTGIH